jgi:hypothetical protein
VTAARSRGKNLRPSYQLSKERRTTATVHEVRDVCTGHVRQGGRDVVVADQLRLDHPARDAGAAHVQGEVDVLLVGLKLAVLEAVLTEVGAIIRVEHEVGVVHLALPAEQVKGIPDEAVHSHQRAQPVPIALTAPERPRMRRSVITQRG